MIDSNLFKVQTDKISSPNYIISKENSQSSNSKLRYSFNEIGNYDSGIGSMSDIFVKGNFAYTATQRAGLIIFNLSSLRNPSIASFYDDPKSISSNQLWDEHSALTSDVFIKEDLAFLADGFNGLVILNISNQLKPQKIGQFLNNGGGIPNIIISNDYAIVRGAKQILIINISNPTDPYLINRIDYGVDSGETINDLFVQENYLFLATSKYFIIIDIAVPTNPQIITEIELNDFGAKIVIQDGFAYIVSGHIVNITDISYELVVYNITTPSNPIYLSRYSLVEITPYVQSIVIDNSTAYIASHFDLISIDISNKTNLVYLGKIDNYDFVMSSKNLALQTEFNNNDLMNGIIFCADSNNGLLIFNFSNPLNASLLSSYDLGFRTSIVTANEDYAFIGTWRNLPFYPSRLDIISISSLSTPELIGSYSLENTILDFQINKEFAYLAVSAIGLIILDISDPSNPILISQYNYTGEFSSFWSEKIILDQENNLVYLANSADGFAIIDISNKTQPFLIHKSRPWEIDAIDVFLAGNLLFLLEGGLDGGFAILDVSNPYNPIQIIRWVTNEIFYNFYVEQDILYVCAEYSPLRIFDISNPTNPKYVSYIENENWYPGQLVINNSIAYIAQNANGLLAVDVSNPSEPKILATYRNQYTGITIDVDTQGNYIFIADGWDGLEIIELVPPEISRKLFLTISILPPVLGVCLVVFIVVRRFKRKNEIDNLDKQ